MNYKPHTHCRVCGSNSLVKYIDLGSLPLSNNLCKTEYDFAEKYPLQVLLCQACGLSQLSIVVDPLLLFGHYVYRSSISQGYVNHCREMAKDLESRYGLTKNSFMIDIAGNDGALLKQFREEIGLRVLNVDPAVNLGTVCKATGIPVFTEFWSELTARRLLNGAGYGQVDLITATNVIAHVDNLLDFMEGVKTLLKPNGVCVVEFPYLLEFIKNGEFDTIYFEHLSYMSIRPLDLLCKQVGMQIIRIEKFPIHGGSVRVHIAHDSSYNFVRDEIKLSLDDYTNFASKATHTIEVFAKNLKYLKDHNEKIAGFAASAKGNTLLNCARINWGTMSYIVDETPEKIGCYSPGTQIPIVSMRELTASPPDYLVILSWNFADEIIRKCKDAGYTGDFIIPIPEFKIIRNDHRTKGSNSVEHGLSHQR